MADALSFDFSGVERQPPKYSPEKQNDDSFYTAFLRGGDVIENFKQANTQYLIEGESTLVNETKKLLQLEENQKRKQTVSAILGDQGIPLETKREVVRNYSITGELPISLVEKYAEKTALENPENLKVTDTTFVNQFQNKLETTKNSRMSSETALGAFLAGIGEKAHAAANTAGLISDKDYKLLLSEYRPIQQEHPIAAGLGGVVPLFAGLPFGVTAGALIGGAIDGAARYAELGVDKVTQTERLVASLAQSGATAAMLATPIWKAATVAQAMLLNGASFVTLGELSRETQNYILDAYPELQRKSSWQGITIEAVAGMIAGGLFGRGRVKFDEQISPPDSAFKARQPTDGSPMPGGHAKSGKTYEGTATQAAEDVPKLKGPPPILRTDESSPLGVTALHDEAKASNLGAGAVLDESGKIAEAVGETRAAILADHYFSKINKEELRGVPSGIVQQIDELTEAGINAYVRTETNPFLYNKQFRNDVRTNITKTIQSFKQAAYHQSKSYYDETEDGIVKGLATYGPSMSSAYRTFDEAQEAFRTLQGYVPYGKVHLSKLDTADNLIKPLSKYEKGEGDYYVQWEFQQPFSRLGTYIFGDDAVSVSLHIPFVGKIGLLDKALTELARIPYVNRFVLPGTHFLKKWVTDPPTAAEDYLRGLEQPLLKELQIAEGALSRANGELDALLYLGRRGSDIAHVWSYGEISSLMRGKGLDEVSVEKVANAYYISRRIDDLSYLYMNRAEYNKLAKRDMISYHFGETPLFAKPVARPEGVSMVWGEATQNVRKISTKELDDLYANGGTLAELAYRSHVGSDYVNYAIVPKGIKKGPLADFVIPRAKGYQSRGWEEYFFIDRAPRKATIDGKAAIDLAALRTTHAAAGSLKDATKLLKQMQKDFPEYDWTIHKDNFNENSLLKEANIYSENLARSNKRGDKLVSVDGSAQLIDPAIMQRRTIAAVSRLAAYDEYMQLFERSFTKSYNKFLVEPGHFPLSLRDFRVPHKASIEETREFENALSNWLYYRSLFDKRSVDQDAWQKSWYWMGSIADYISKDLAKVAQFTGKNLYPPELLRRVATAFLIYLNPIRTIFLQSSQILQLVFASPAYFANPNAYARDILSLIWGSATVPHKGITRSGNIFGKAEAAVGRYIGAKVAGMPQKEYDMLVQAWKDSGIPYAIDNNLMISGVLGRGDRALQETPVEFFANSATRVVTAPVKAGKMVGFDPGEGMLMMSAWLEARIKFIKENPGVAWNTKEALTRIQVDARLRGGELNQAGALAWNRGILVAPLQFISTPYKLLLNTLTGKAFSAEEKTRMFVGNVLWFGPTAYFLGGLLDSLREKIGDALPPEAWLALKGGVTDLTANFVLTYGMDDKEKATSSTLAVSKGFSPFGDKFGITEALSKLHEDQFAKVLLGPSWTLFNTKNGRIPTAIRDIAGTFQGREPTTKEAVQSVIRNLGEITSGGSNWMRMTISTEMGRMVASTGNDTGLHADRKAAIAKIFGVQTYEEIDFNTYLGKKIDEDKEVKEMAKYLAHQALENARQNYGKNPDVFQKQNEMINSVMSAIKGNPHLERKLMAKLPEVQREMLKNDGENVYTFMYSEALKKSDEERVKMSNFLRSSPDPRLRELAEQINEGLNTMEGKGY